MASKGLFSCLADIEAHIIALILAGQALWDPDFNEAISLAKTGVEGMQAWVKHQLHVRSPQTLIVPSKDSWHDLD